MAVWCFTLKMPCISQERYIRESCSEAFDILCEEIKKLALVDGEDRVIEVTLQKDMKIEEVKNKEVKTEEEGSY
jgi:anthranilate phosphoribosyltransferase